MDPSKTQYRIGGSRATQFLLTRRASLLVAALAALMAGGLFFVFVQHYKSNTTATPLTDEYVFTAKSFIPQGTAAEVISAKGLMSRTQVSGRQVVPGAIADPSEIADSVSAAPIAAGQQITVNQFTRSNASFSAYLAGNQRAIELTLSDEAGLTSYLQATNTVDVMGSMNNHTWVLAQDVTVLANSGGEVDLRVTDQQAVTITNFQVSGKVWLSLRPTVGAADSVPKSELYTSGGTPPSGS
jgi:Flp pilus assembly protein CpaB